MIDWLNTNSGSVIAFLTLAYVVTTILMWRSMRKANVLTQANIELLNQAERNRLRPHVVFELVEFRGLISAEVANIGQTTAHGIRIDSMPTIRAVGRDYAREIYYISKGIETLAPSRRLSILVGSYAEIKAEFPEERFEVEIEYRDGFGETYHEQTTIDLKERSGLRIKENTVHDISKTIEKIQADIHYIRQGGLEPLVRVIPESEYQEAERCRMQDMVEQAKAFQESMASRKSKRKNT
jgi:hypothetical protein